MTTFTPNLRLALQEDNENPSTWGDVVNEKVIELIEEAVSGVATVNVTGTTNVNIATSVVSGGPDDARHAVLYLTGVVGGSGIDLIVPSVEKVYIVDSAYTGETVRIIPSGGASGIDVAPGYKGLLYTNGTSIVEVTGDTLKASNNLSDLVDVATARGNLGLGDLATLNAGSGLEIDGSDLNVTFSGAITGEVKTWLTSTAPSGYLECDGSAVSRSTYADLFAVIGESFGDGNGTTTFNLPDFRGYFLRGWDNGAGVDPDAASRTDRGDGTTGDNIGTKQEDELESHTHSFNKNLGVPGASRGVGPDPVAEVNSSSPYSITATGGNETRPKNINVMYIIKT